jgi:hypothetical protein
MAIACGNDDPASEMGPLVTKAGYHSFGGWKDSAFGDHRMYGSEAVHFYTRGKVITSRWPAPPPADRRGPAPAAQPRL